jgi:hypothetical protein
MGPSLLLEDCKYSKLNSYCANIQTVRGPLLLLN